MLEKIKNHNGKIFVFTINVLLAAIAVLILREKDQTRLLENAQPENPVNENILGKSLPSFENSVSIDDQGSTAESDNVYGQVDVSPPLSSPVDKPSAVPAPPAAADPVPKNSTPASTSKSNTASPASPAVSVPTPAPTPASVAPPPSQSASPSNAKTKTS